MDNILLFTIKFVCLKAMPFKFKYRYRRGEKYLKNQPCDVIKRREMKGEMEKKTPKKKMDNSIFL